MESKPNVLARNRLVPLIGTLVFAFFLLGLSFPEPWWGVHFLNFVSPGMKVLCLAVAVGLMGYAWIGKEKTIVFGTSTEPKKGATTLIFLAGLIAGFVFYQLPIAGDIYGNSRGFQDVLDTTVDKLPSDFYSRLFSFEFVPGNGRGGVTLIVEFISYAFQVNMYDAFKIMDAFCGAGFVAVWLWSVQRFIKDLGWRILLAAIGLTSPFLINYFGHVETYAPIFLVLYIWLLLFVLFLRNQNSRFYWLLLVLLILGIRLHTLMYLLAPAFLVATLYQFKLKTILNDKVTDIRQVFKWMYLPLFAVGLLLYFFVFKDYDDPRILQDFEDIDRLFLPMKSPEAPLDNYNMFSMSHLLDFFNIILFWSPALLVILGYLFVQKRKELNWKLPEVNLLILTFFLFATILFTMNPLFSMPMDWDLFCFPVPILLLLLLLGVEQIQKEGASLKLIATCGAMVLLCLPAFSVFLNLKQNSQRTERVGVHIYKSYYEHASTYILMSLKMVKGNDAYRERMNHLIEELEPHALPGKDQQYAELLVDKSYFDFYVDQNPLKARASLMKSMEYQRLQNRFEPLAFDINKTLIQQGFEYSEEDKKMANEIIERGKVLLREKKEYELALQEFRYSRYYDPMNGRAILLSIESLFLMKRYPEAFSFARDLVGLRFPDYQTALRVGIHTALEAKMYGDALRYCNLFLENFDGDETIITVKKRLDAREKVEELKFLFNRGA